ncbi:Acyl-CoA N-acyltransferase [Penicillium fimorum]|uniref:Acyl-CoA N-acyltransferase n=1 Tax=Penicillium fimorum TaxID=1882269 RepID=A0A9X0C6K3_9EURO|nr:Acyl-CoA N-acyltransferase [Penicillium fimorum]
MRNTTCHLPNGLTFDISPVFGGVTFKSTDFNIRHKSTFPPGWTIIINTERCRKTEKDDPDSENPRNVEDDFGRFTTPTLTRDSLYISYIVNPPTSEFKSVTSPTRQIAMMLWATLWWYFHEPEPDLHLETVASSKTPRGGRPKGEWRIKIKREGIFKGRNLLQKLERMGLIATEDSSVGLQPIETRDSSSWSTMFVSRRSFWQLDPRLFLFTLTPTGGPMTPPVRSLNTSPTPDGMSSAAPPALLPMEATFHTANMGQFTSVGPFTSGSHLPTYYPPPPMQFTSTNGVRHPVRPKPPHQGEVFYVRYIPSLSQYLSFRVAFVPMTSQGGIAGGEGGTPVSTSVTSISQHLTGNISSDLDTLHRWMNVPRVEAMWAEGGPKAVQEKFLLASLTSRHSFPVIGCWDGKPFGYFEIYWVKEDPLGRLVDHAGNYDRGIHLLVGEQEFRGAHRVAVWLSALVHHCFLADMRTASVVLEPRIDNIKLINYLQEAGFYKEGEVSFPHKHSAIMRIKREYWESPAL